MAFSRKIFVLVAGILMFFLFMHSHPNEYRLLSHNSNTHENDIEKNMADYVQKSQLTQYRSDGSEKQKLLRGIFYQEVGSWQMVLRDTFYVFSAYLDRPEPGTNYSTIQIVSMMSREYYTTNTIKCELTCYQNTNVSVYGSVVCAKVRGRHNDTIVHVVLHCRVAVPSYLLHNATVTLLPASANRIHSNSVQLRYNLQDKFQYNFTVCMAGPVRSGQFLYNTLEFVEWVEMSMLLGAQKIVLYNLSIPATWDPYIYHYIQRNIMTLVQWHLPPETEIHWPVTYFFHESCLADCFLRMHQHSHYIVHTDMDELIVPRHPKDRTWSDMIHRSSCDVTTPAYGAWHMFFHLDYYHSSSIMSYTQRVKMRSSTLIPFPFRCKYISNTVYATTAENHRLRNQPTCAMDPLRVGALHHYRHVTVAQATLGRNYTIDHTMEKYGNTLMTNIRNTVKTVNNTDIS